MLTFIKLGGSLITNKRVESSFRESVVVRLAQEVQAALVADPELQILIGHGSGSFGHFAAHQFRTIEGVHTLEEWRGFAQVATVAAELNDLVARILQGEGVPVWRIQPSASVISRNHVIVQMALEPLRQALRHRLVPLVYGDVAIDEVLGGTIISTETVFFYLAQYLPVERILLLGEVDGVYNQNKQAIPHITPENFQAIKDALGGSAGVDVTGGMETKVRDMLALTQTLPNLSIRILNGNIPGLLQQTLLGQAQPGTLIHANAERRES